MIKGRFTIQDMGWVSGALYVLSGIAVVPYGVYIDKLYVEGASIGTFLFPDGNAIGLFAVVAVLFVVATVLACLAVRRRKRGKEVDVQVAPASSRARGRDATHAPRVRHTQFYDEYGGMRVRRSFDSRRPVYWLSGAPTGFLEPNEFGGYTVIDTHGTKIGDVADLPDGIDLLKKHLASK